ncbi:MAG TPA: alpha/beta fold hydrolase [Pyrinomonadaceae bacterium]|nr:alpha/beta fold hydrolase [Pyrinomonadaceae bacterium]
MTRVVILVPGIMGSVLELRHAGGQSEVIWPGPFSSLIFAYNKMNELLIPELEATDLIRRFSISNQYQQIIDDLGKCGFREKGQGGKPPTLFACPYDWRKDNALAAETLAAKIDGAVAQHGAGVEVTLVGHSMGGLVSRYYLESGDFNARPGFGAVSHLITLGTPHRGSPLALSAALGREKRLFLSAAQVKQIANDPRYPALYQLMPPPGEPFAWMDGPLNAYAEVDIYDAGMAQALGLTQQNLKAARDFHSKLDPGKRPKFQGKPIRYFFFAGTRQTTYSSVKVLDLMTNPKTYSVLPWELEDAGDGTVPAWSASLTGVQGQPVGGEHGTIYRNGLLLQTLGALLGKPGVLAPTPTRVEVSLRERVVDMGAPVHASLTFGQSVTKLDGQLTVEKVQVDAQGNLTFSAPVSVHKITYTGLNVEQLNVVFKAPNANGEYRVAYYPAGSTKPAGSDELFVQFP